MPVLGENTTNRFFVSKLDREHLYSYQVATKSSVNLILTLLQVNGRRVLHYPHSLFDLIEVYFGDYPNLDTYQVRGNLSSRKRFLLLFGIGPV